MDFSSLQSILDKNSQTFAKLDVKVAKLKSLGDQTNLSGPLGPLAPLAPYDIEIFYEKRPRCDNDRANKKREQILEKLQSLGEEFYSDEIYGARWTNLKEKWDAALHQIAEKKSIPKFSSYTVTKKAGRGNNFDFSISYFDSAEPSLDPVGNALVEFKFGAETITDLPQFLSIYTTSCKLLPESYEEFWFTHYLNKYIACDSEISSCPLPTKEEYLKKINETTPSTPLTQKMKEREEMCKREKAAVVNESIKEYLTHFAKDINIQLFREKLMTSQKNKIYLLWHGDRFKIDEMSLLGLPEIKYEGMRNGNVIILRAGILCFNLLLRWKNHKGIAGPAWQISLARLGA